MTNLVRDLLDLPEAVRKGDYVQGLADGIAKPEAACREDYRPARYVATGDDA